MKTGNKKREAKSGMINTLKRKLTHGQVAIGPFLTLHSSRS